MAHVDNRAGRSLLSASLPTLKKGETMTNEIRCSISLEDRAEGQPPHLIGTFTECTTSWRLIDRRRFLGRIAQVGLTRAGSF